MHMYFCWRLSHRWFHIACPDVSEAVFHTVLPTEQAAKISGFFFRLIGGKCIKVGFSLTAFLLL